MPWPALIARRGGSISSDSLGASTVPKRLDEKQGVEHT